MANTLDTMTVNISPSPGVINAGTASVVVTTSSNVDTIIIGQNREPTIAQVLAKDEYEQPFIVVFDDGKGKVTFDGGFPKFYNNQWNGTSSYPNYPVSFKYLVNVVNFIKDSTKPNKVLIYSTSTPGEPYTVGDQTNPNMNSASFHIGMPAALSNQGYDVVRKTSADFGWFQGIPNQEVDIPYSELIQYCAVIFMSTNSDGSRISNNTVNNFVQYQQSGGGIFIVTDHDVLQTSANRLANRFGANFYGIVNRTASNPVYNVGNIIAENGLHPIWDNIPTSQSLHVDTSEGAIDATSDPIYESGTNYDLNFGYQKVHVLVKSNTGVIERAEFDYMVAGDLNVEMPDLITPTLKPNFIPTLTGRRWNTRGVITKGNSIKFDLYIHDYNVTLYQLDPINNFKIPLTQDGNTIKVKFTNTPYEKEFNINRKTYDNLDEVKLPNIVNTINELELEDLNVLNPAKAFQQIINVTELPELNTAKTSQNIIKYFKPQPKTQNEALIVDNEKDLAELTGKRYRIRTYGYGVPNSQSPFPEGSHLGLYDEQKQLAITGVARGYIVAFLNQFGEWQTNNNSFDLLANGHRTSDYTGKTITQAEAFAEHLKFINDNHPGTPVVVYTYDEPSHARTLSGIPEQLYRMGATPEIFRHPKFYYRACYILLGQANIGQGKGAEFLNGIRDEYAGVGDPNAWMDISFNIRNGSIAINGTHITDYQDIVSENPIVINSIASGIEPPSFQTIYNNWDRFDGVDYFKAGETISQLGTPLANTQANSWNYNSSTDQVTCTVNSNNLVGFVSNEKLNNYKHEVTISSTNADDDLVGVIIASAMQDNVPLHLMAVRSAGGTIPYWGLVIATNKVNHPGYDIIEPDALLLVDGSQLPDISENIKPQSEYNGWQDMSPIRIWIEREGNKITAWTSKVGDPTLAKDERTILEYTIDETLPEFYNQKHSYGYVCQSQDMTTFTDIVMEGNLSYTQVWDAKTIPPILYEYNQATNTWEESSGDIFEIVGDNTETLNPITGKTFKVYQLGNNKNISSIN